MEHRFHRRHIISIVARLIVEGKCVGWWRVKEMSAGGFCIRAVHHALREGRIIDVDFIKSGPHQNPTHCVRAMVIHNTDKTIGLMFSHVQKVDELIAGQLVGRTDDTESLSLSRQKR